MSLHYTSILIRSFSPSISLNILTTLKHSSPDSYFIRSRLLSIQHQYQQSKKLSSNSMAEQVQDNKKFTGVRLPTNLKPTHYDLSLKPDLKKFTFEGSVGINYECDSSVKSQVVLHAIELVITDGSVQSGSTVHPLTKVTYSTETETATLDFAGDLHPQGTIKLNFKGTLNDRLKGFYRTTFKVKDQGEEHSVYAATTQFEATDARKCFPCWDEPACKASFSVKMTYNPECISPTSSIKNIALSNMPEINRTKCSDGTYVVEFDRTPIMSTYLLAFIVGPFERIEGTDGKRQICVYTTPGKTEQGRFALDVACKSLTYYEDYFKIPYPLKKMDLIAIPDFNSGAMENWGLVTYRETCLLVDPGNTSTQTKQYIALVVAHELAHQWFGNLVTMEWWTHLWLNEGFATFMEFLCVDHIFPEYDIWTQFLTDSYTCAMNLDALHNSHPIEVPVNHPSEIDEIFDLISYEKGSTVIRMLYNYIGDDAFRRGMNQYLTKYAYKNALTENLWESLEAASGKPVCKIMSGWTLQKGFPYITVSCVNEGDSTKLTLTQKKFSCDGTLPADEAEILWVLPIDAITEADPLKPISLGLLESRSGTMTVTAAKDNWIKLNANTVGLYRTVYPETMMTKLWAAIADQTLQPLDRLGLQDDFYALCKAGQVQTVDLLKLLKSFKSETNHTVWTSIDNCVGYLNSLLSNTDFQDKFHQFGIKLYSDIYNKVGWDAKEGEKHTDAMTRSLVINRLLRFNYKPVIEEAKLRFQAHLKKEKLITPDLRSAVYAAVSVNGGKEAFDNLLGIYRIEELHEEKVRALRSLGFTKDPDCLKRVLELTMSDEVRNQDRMYTIRSFGVSNPPVAWQFLQDNKDELRKMYANSHIITHVIKATTENFASEERAKEVAKFFEANPFPGGERTVQQSIENIRLAANWLTRDSASIKEYLSKSS